MTADIAADIAIKTGENNGASAHGRECGWRFFVHTGTKRKNVSSADGCPEKFSPTRCTSDTINRKLVLDNT